MQHALRHCVCMQDYGGKIQSIDDYDEMLDHWGEMLEQGDSGDALEMLSARLPKIPGLANLETLLSQVRLLQCTTALRRGNGNQRLTEGHA